MKESKFYSRTRPKENRRLMSAFAIPGVRNIHIFKNNKSDKLRTRDAFISIDVKNKAIRISKSAVLLMNLEKGQRFTFLTLDDAVYCAKSSEGNALCVKPHGDMHTKSALFIHYIKRKMGAYRSFRCPIKQTKSEFNANPLYELVLPRRYKVSYFMKNTQQ